MRFKFLLLPIAGLALGLTAYFALSRLHNFTIPEQFPGPDPGDADDSAATAELEQATFGSGCFWCSEAVFQRLKGVRSVTSGYSGGTVKNPSYEQVCTGTTGHAEVIQVTFAPGEISYTELLEVFWRTHDPTTPNQQGHDLGTQYRSVIFYHNDRQRQLAEEYKHKIDEAHVYDAPLVTEIAAFAAFYRAEAYHQNYFQENGGQPYCRAVIRPKIQQLERVFPQKLKEAAP